MLLCKHATPYYLHLLNLKDIFEQLKMFGSVGVGGHGECWRVFLDIDW